MNKTAVIIVLYNPTIEDIDHLRNLASSHYGAIIDNSPERSFTDAIVGKMSYHYNNGNIGLAAAQNKGVSKCLENQPDTTHFVFLDQDSRIGDDYPELVASELSKACMELGKTAIIGPTVINSDTKKKYSSYIHKDTAVSDSFLDKLFIISSGSCISFGAWQEIGCFKEKMFIDFVDSEWCWRAKSKGYMCLSTTNLHIKHKVGQCIFKVGPYQDIVSKPFRYYYQYRNFLWLCRLKYVPLKWKINTGVKYILRFLYVPFATKSFKMSLINMKNGIKDGLKYEIE